jgi:Methyltransferase domain
MMIKTLKIEQLTNQELDAIFQFSPYLDKRLLADLPSPVNELFDRGRLSMLYRGMGTRFAPGDIYYITPHLNDFTFTAISAPITRKYFPVLHQNNKFWSSFIELNAVIDEESKAKTSPSLNLFLSDTAFEKNYIDEALRINKKLRPKFIRFFLSILAPSTQKELNSCLQKINYNGVLKILPFNEPVIELDLRSRDFAELIQLLSSRVFSDPISFHSLSMYSSELLLEKIYEELNLPFKCSPDPSWQDLYGLHPAIAFILEKEKCDLDATPAKQLLRKILGYLQFLGSLDTNDKKNITISLASESNFSAIRPKVNQSSYVYDSSYRLQSFVPTGYLKGVSQQSRDYPFSYSGGSGYSHEIRHRTIATYIKFLVDTLRIQFPGQTIRWLDIGCGDGRTIFESLSNISGDIKVVGCDFSDLNIIEARSFRESRASFVNEDCFKLANAIPGSEFHLISLFEVLEHLSDPLSFLKQIREIASGYIIGGSPLDENLSDLPSREHLYSFSSNGFESIFASSGMNPVMLNSMKVGSYNNNHDWCTCIASPRGLSL